MGYTDTQLVIASQYAYSKKKGDKYSDLDNSAKGWKVIDYIDDKASGMYACVIDTNDGNAIIAFRGSESKNMSDIEKDWIMSDFNLLNNTLTPQQAIAEKYTEYVIKEYGDYYGGFTLTGHSLGGNLAEHATITASSKTSKKIKKCVNLDGPGFSRKYIEVNKHKIKRNSGKVTHYQWSVVGALLNPIPGAKYKTVQADTPNGIDYLHRHDPKYVVSRRNKDGSFKRDKWPDPLALRFGPESRLRDYKWYVLTGTVAHPVGEITRKAAKNYEIHPVKKHAPNYTVSSISKSNLSSSTGRSIDVTCNTIYKASNSIAKCGNRIDRLGERIRDISSSLDSDTEGLRIIKKHLTNIAGSIDSQGKKITKLGTSGATCMKVYQQTEKTIAELR